MDGRPGLLKIKDMNESQDDLKATSMLNENCQTILNKGTNRSFKDNLLSHKQFRTESDFFR